MPLPSAIIVSVPGAITRFFFLHPCSFYRKFLVDRASDRNAIRRILAIFQSEKKIIIKNNNTINSYPERAINSNNKVMLHNVNKLQNDVFVLVYDVYVYAYD